MKSLNDWLNEGYVLFNDAEMQVYLATSQLDRCMQNTAAIVCKDGFSVSIQASHGHYCTPRKNFSTVETKDGVLPVIDYSMYTEFELGFPSENDEIIAEYAENPAEAPNTVYGWVPREAVEKLIASHGGIVAVQKIF